MLVTRIFSFSHNVFYHRKHCHLQTGKYFEFGMGKIFILLSDKGIDKNSSEAKYGHYKGQQYGISWECYNTNVLVS